jgi:glycosyltransferase involved in cell wall biosynthesis
MIAGSFSVVEPKVFFVGARWRQHASVSGYDSVSRYIGQRLPLPLVDRWDNRLPPTAGRMARLVHGLIHRVDAPLNRLCEAIAKPTYSIRLLRLELSVITHMVWRRAAIYHVLYGETDFWMAGVVARLTGNYVVASFHDGEKIMSDCGVDARLLQTLSAIVLLGDAQREYIERFADPSKIAVIQHGIDTKFFFKRPRPPRDQTPIVLTVGGHTRDYATLSLATSLVKEALPDVRFIAVSANVGNKGALLEHPAFEHVTDLSDEELRDLYHRASVAVFSFDYAVANNSVLEAMASGLPIVATDVGAVNEYVTVGAGTLVPARDPQAMADALVEILTDSHLAAQMSDAARAAAERVEFALIADEMRSFYAALVSSEAARAPRRSGRPSHADQRNPPIEEKAFT